MAKKDIEEKIKKARREIKDDRGFTLLPLNTEEDMRRALRVVLTSLVELYETIETLQSKAKKEDKTNETTP